MTLEEAKELFISSNCSKFEMGRECPSQYELYLELHISKEIENEWREKQLDKYFNDIKNNCNEQKIWNLYNKMYELAEAIKNNSSILIMRETFEFLTKKLSKEDKVIISETIVGRKAIKCRSGMIYLSYDTGDRVNASYFALGVLELLDDEFPDNLKQRAENVKVICENIIEMLSLKNDV